MELRHLAAPFAVALASMLAVIACADDAGDAASVTTVNDAGPETDGGSESPSSAALPSYAVPGSEAMAAIAIDGSGTFYVDSSESGRIYRGQAGAASDTTLELFADLASSGVTRGGHMAASPSGKKLYLLSALGDAPRVRIVDVASKSVERSIDIVVAGPSPFTLLQDIAVDPLETALYVTNAIDNVIHKIDLASGASSSFPLSSEFPKISDTAQGFLNASGVAVSKDGRHLLVVHLIDKHLYRVSLDPSSLGKAQQVDTTPYNVSGNGLWLGEGGEVIEVAGDELRLYRFKMNDDLTRGDLLGRYQGDDFEQGLTYAVSWGDRILALNGSGIGLAALGGGAGGGGGGPPGPADAGDADGGGALPVPADGGGFPGFGGGAVDAGAKKLPIRVLQIAK